MKKRILNVKGTEVTITMRGEQDYISLTDMLKAKDGDYFIGDWLRNRNTLEFLGIWEAVHNPGFNYGEFDTIRSQAGLNRFRISVKDWAEQTNPGERPSDHFVGVTKMVDLAHVEVPEISHHLKEVFQSGKLQEEGTIRKIRIVQNERVVLADPPLSCRLKAEGTVAKNATVQTEGGRWVTRELECDNPDMVISIGYRQNNHESNSLEFEGIGPSPHHRISCSP